MAATHGMCLAKIEQLASLFLLQVPGKAYQNKVRIQIVHSKDAVTGVRPPGQWDGVARPVGTTSTDTLIIRVHCTDDTRGGYGGGETGQIDITITDPVIATNTSTEQATTGIVY